ncbi:MAG: hypothetical protein ACXAD7_14225 [Candidatus Kariarchaeaceae archaeon]
MSDLLDLIILVPYVSVIFFQIARSIKPYKTENMSFPFQNSFLVRKCSHDLFGFTFFGVFCLGFGIHLGANAIDVYITRIAKIKDELPDDLVNYIHFYDEILGHAILFFGLLGLLQYIIFKEFKYPDINAQVKLEEIRFAFLLGFGFGSVLSIYFIEATYFIEIMLIYSVLSLGGISLIIKKNRINLVTIIYTAALRYTYFGIICTATLYYFIIGSFEQPSEVFGPF